MPRSRRGAALAVRGVGRDRGLPPPPGAQAYGGLHSLGLHSREAREHARASRRRRVCEQARQRELEAIGAWKNPKPVAMCRSRSRRTACSRLDQQIEAALQRFSMPLEQSPSTASASRREPQCTGITRPRRDRAHEKTAARHPQLPRQGQRDRGWRALLETPVAGRVITIDALHDLATPREPSSTPTAPTTS